MKDFIVRQSDEMLNFLIKKFDMINVYLKELEEYGSTSNTDMGNMDNVDSIVQSLYEEDILYRKHYDYDTLYNLVWKAMDKAVKIANKKYNKQINTNKDIMKINESQLKKIIKESVKNVLKEQNQDFNIERYVIDTLTQMRDEINVFLENTNNTYPGEYGSNIEMDMQEYVHALNNLKNAFNSFKDLCLDDWEQH